MPSSFASASAFLGSGRGSRGSGAPEFSVSGGLSVDVSGFSGFQGFRAVEVEGFFGAGAVSHPGFGRVLRRRDPKALN